MTNCVLILKRKLQGILPSPYFYCVYLSISHSLQTGNAEQVENLPQKLSERPSMELPRNSKFIKYLKVLSWPGSKKIQEIFM